MLGSTFFLALVLLGLASAAPRANKGLRPKWAQDGHQLTKRSFKINRVQMGSGSPSAVKAAYKAYSKWSIPMPDGLVDAHKALQKKKKKGAKAAGGASPNTTAAAAGETGNVTNTPEAGDVEFLSPITVGGQKMVMDFDTGSSDLWLFSTSLPANQQTGHTIFDPTKSQSFKQLQGNSFAITFGDGSNATGNIVGTDTVDIGGATATNQAVELASSVSDSFVQDTQSNGLVGLAFSKINTVKPQQQKTFFDTISGQLAQPVLAASLKAGANGFYAFGQVDQTAFQGNLTSVPVDNSNGFWQVTSNAFQIGNGQIQQSANASPAIADTGTTLLLVDDAVAKAYYATVQGAQLDPQQGLFTFPCASQLQDLSVALGDNYMAKIDKSLLNFQQADAQTCVGAVQGNQGSNLQIYGDILFKSQFAVFNIKDNTSSSTGTGGKITDFADSKTGTYNRQPSAFRNFISAEPGAEFPPEKGRYMLYVSYACPWAHRTLIVRKLKGLEDFILYTVVHWHMAEKGWRFVTPNESLPGANVQPDAIHPTYTHLRDIYFAQNPDYTGRFLVPTLYDTKTSRIVSNESSEIIRMFYTEFDSQLPSQYAAVDLLPSSLRADIEATNEWTYNDINNGVYKSGFATSAAVYEENVTALFRALDRAEEHLASNHAHGKGPFYFGAHITEADVRLYTTIVRFDAVYVQHFKCNLRDIRSGYPALHRWVRRMYWGEPAFHETTQFEHIKKHYTQSHKQINPHGITPLGPVPDILPIDDEVPAVKAALGS